MNAQRLLLVLLGTVLAGGALWFALGTGEEEPSPAGVAAPTVARPGGSARPDVDLADSGTTPEDEVETASIADDETRHAVVAEEAAPRPDWLADGEQWIEGIAVAAPGAPEDEELRVLALSREMSAGGIQDGPAAEVWASVPEYADPLVSSAVVAEDGTFRIAVPADATEAHLAISGRYTFARSTTTVALPSDESVTLTGELGAWILGRLLSDGAGEIEGTEVVLGVDLSQGFDPEKLRVEAWEQKVPADAGGTFEMRGANPKVPHAVGVDADGFALQLILGIDVRPGERREIEIPLQRGATLRGVAVDESGSPVAGAEIEVGLMSFMGRVIGAVRETETDAEGAFELENVIPGELELVASLTGYRTSRTTLPHAVSDGATVDDITLVLSRGVRIGGKVSFPDGSPAGGADVSAWLPGNMFGGPDAMSPRRKGSSDSAADGAFLITGLVDTPYEIEAIVLRDDQTWMARADGVAPGTEDLELVLIEMTPLRGRVVDANDSPITKFTVVAAQESGAMFGTPGELEVRGIEDESGAFAITDLHPGRWSIFISADGFGTSKERDATVPPEDPSELVFVLEPAAAIEGIVIDTSGAPAPGAIVSVELGMIERMRAMRMGGLPETRCDEEGRFRMKNVDPGETVLTAKLEGFASSEPVEVLVESGAVQTEVVLELREGGTLTGELFADNGEPDPGKTIIVQRLPTYSPQHLPMTDKNGQFEVRNLEPGNWQVVTSDGFMTGDPDRGAQQAMADFMSTMKTEFLEIVDGQVTHVVLGAQAEEPVDFHGIVLHGGEPVPDAMVIVMPDDASSLAAMKMNTTNSEGRFEFTLDRPGNVMVSIQQGAALGQQNNIERSETIPEGVTEHELVVELPLGRISGRVYGPDGDPQAEARITLHLEGGTPTGSFLGARYADTTTDANGNFDLLYLDPGTYTIGAGGVIMGGMLGGESEGGRVLQSGIQVADGEWVNGIDFRLKNPGVLKGRVLDEAGSPVPGATLFLRDENGRLLERFSMQETDSTGKFRFEAVAPGHYSVFARTAFQAGAESQAVHVQSGQETETHVTLTAGTVLVITCVDQSNDDVTAIVSVKDSQGREVGTMRSMPELVAMLALDPEDRKHRVGPLPPGEYEVIATMEDGRKARRPVTVKGQAERKVKLRLR